MKTWTKKVLWGAALLLAFILWTHLVCVIDVRAIGPRDSAVGFASLNGWFHRLTGVHFTLYHITDWGGLAPVFICFVFAMMGLCQWIKRRNLFRVDASILLLGVFYLLVMGAYLYFESHVINRRPVLIAGFLEASYPSSTTLLILCVMPTAWMQWNLRLKEGPFKRCLQVLIMAFTLIMVLGRLISGVHWLSDIVGGALLSGALVLGYDGACCAWDARWLPAKQSRF